MKSEYLETWFDDWEATFSKAMSGPPDKDVGRRLIHFGLSRLLDRIRQEVESNDTEKAVLCTIEFAEQLHELGLAFQAPTIEKKARSKSASHAANERHRKHLPPEKTTEALVREYEEGRRGEGRGATHQAVCKRLAKDNYGKEKHHRRIGNIVKKHYAKHESTVKK